MDEKIEFGEIQNTNIGYLSNLIWAENNLFRELLATIVTFGGLEGSSVVGQLHTCEDLGLNLSTTPQTKDIQN